MSFFTTQILRDFNLGFRVSKATMLRSLGALNFTFGLFLGTQKYQNWFHVKSDWQGISEISTMSFHKLHAALLSVVVCVCYFFV